MKAGGNIMTDSLELGDGGPRGYCRCPNPRRFDEIRRKGGPDMSTYTATYQLVR